MKTPLHFGPAPHTANVTNQVIRSHRLGFRTILAAEYDRLAAEGIHVEDYDLVLQPIHITALPLGEVAP